MEVGVAQREKKRELGVVKLFQEEELYVGV